MSHEQSTVSSESTSDRLAVARARFRLNSRVALAVTLAAIPVTLLVAGLEGFGNDALLALPLLLVALVHWRAGRSSSPRDVRAGRVLGWIGVALAATLLAIAGSVVHDTWLALVVYPVLAALLLVHLLVVVSSWLLIARDPSDTGAAIGLKAWLVIAGLLLLLVYLMLPAGFDGHKVSRNENTALADLRTFASAEAAYQAANGGFFDEPACLIRPSRCIPGYPENAPVFADASVLPATRSGYVRRFHPGVKAFPSADQAGRVSPSSLTGWAYTAVPERFGRTGVRSFCLDHEGLIVFSMDERPLDVRNARCPAELTPLR